MTAFNDTITCVLLATSDLHGHIRPTDYGTGEERTDGLAKLATIIREEKKRDPELLLIDNGDLLQGSPLAAYAAGQSGQSREGADHPFITILEDLDYDAAIPGNHEFNYGLGMLRSVVSQSGFPWLSANIVDARTGEPAFGKPYTVKRLRGGVKAVTLGVTTAYIPNWENPKHIEGLQFLDAVDTVRSWAARIRKEEDPDLFIVSYHGGFERNLADGSVTERLTGENQAYALCTEVEGIDALVTGHQHRLLAGEVGGVAVVQPGCNGQAIGKISFDLVRENSRWRVAGKRAELLKPDAATADERVMELTREPERETQAWLDQPIGKLKGEMTVDNPFACRTAPHPFIAFIHRVQMDATGADVSVASLLAEETRGFGPIITMRDVLTTFIYPNTLTVLRLTGRDIRAALEQTAAYFAVGENGELIVSSAFLEPKPQHYNYDMWAGIEYELDASQPIGSRVVLLARHGRPVAPDELLDVVMNNYRAGGGGDYDMFRGRPIVREVASEMSELATAYIRRQGTIFPENSSNWRVFAGR